ncbi:MAG: hypothetical protein HOV66_06575, partial [Streptomycetaceae bacterium]|nr:hypothetical protein [Streptomycetaceae bacterium]
MTLRRTASVAGRLRRRTTGGTARPALPRLIGGISGAVVLALVAAAAVIGVGAAGTNAHVSDADAWLAATSRNSLVHVNGTTGQVDGRVALPGPVKGPLELVQNGTTVLVLDRGTGTVSRIDPAQLTVAAGQPSGNPNLRLVGAGDAVWIVDRQAGTVQPIDPVTLAPTGGPVDLGTRPLGGARADADGVLWVLLPDRGEAVPLGADGPGEHVKAGEPGAPLRLTVAGGRAAVLDSRGGTLVVLSSTGQGLTLRLPSGLTRAAPERVLVPDEQVGSLVPILAPDTGALVVANVESGVVQAVDLEPAAQRDYAQPQVQGSRVYIPDRASGTLLVYDTAAAAFTAPIRVTGVPGRLEVHTRGDRVWVNDDANATAAVIDEEGTVHLIDKYATG